MRLLWIPPNFLQGICQLPPPPPLDLTCQNLHVIVCHLYLFVVSVIQVKIFYLKIQPFMLRKNWNPNLKLQVRITENL